MVAVAHGNDGMGSIRIPSACCGLVGIKPGLGVVPSGIGNGAWYDMAENGALATTVEDCALVLSVMADDPSYATVRVPGRLRVAVSTKMTAPLPLDPRWAAATLETGELLRGAGHTVTTATPSYGQRTTPSELVRWFAGVELDAQLLADRSKLHPRTRRHAAVGRLTQRLGLPNEKGRAWFRRRADAFFAEHDVLVTPTLAQPPIEASAWSERGWLRNMVSNVRYAPFCAPWNLVGFPAMAVPAGVHPDGVPLSVQLVGRPGSESLLLGVARLLEQLRPWQRIAPDH
jgi:amidase